MAIPVPIVVLRTVKASPLSWQEADGNFDGLRTFCAAASNLLAASMDDTGKLNANAVSTVFITALLPMLEKVGDAKWRPRPYAAADVNGIWSPDTGTVYIEAKGQLLQKAVYVRLAAEYGNDYSQIGDDQAATFRLPDLSGKFPLVASATHPAGQTGGAESQNVPNHAHAIGVQTAYWAGDFNHPVANTGTGAITSFSGGHTVNTMPPFFAGVCYVVAGYKVGGVMI